MEYKILLIEDDVRLSDLIKRGLENEKLSVSQAFEGKTGINMATQEEFDLIVSDIILPDLSGLDVCQQIKQIRADIPIIMLTALGTIDDKVEGFDSGADDYMVKPFDIRELQIRIKAHINRTKNLSNEKTLKLSYAGVEIDLKKKTVSRENIYIPLTPKEFNLLEYMVRNNERVLSRDEIAEKVWHTNFDRGTNFIDVYINYLRKKIDKQFTSKLIHTKPGMGFMLMKQENDPNIKR